jgi:toxin secretion/phage lysis holin
MDKAIRFFAYIFGMLAAFWLSVPEIVRVLIALMVFDIVIGTLCAIINGTVDAKIRWNGILKKTLMLLMVGVAFILEDFALRAGYNLPLVIAVAGFYSFNEGMSIIKNARNVIPVPEILDEFFDKVFGNKKEIE